MTKEQILKQKFQKPPIDEYNPIHEAMDEYAKQVAIEFKKWTFIEAPFLKEAETLSTDEQLFELFKNQQP